MDELCKIEAHDAEVLCLEYSQAVQPTGAATAGAAAAAGAGAHQRRASHGAGGHATRKRYYVL